MQIKHWILITAVVITVTLIILVLVIDDPLVMSRLQVSALFVTGLIVFWYTLETRELRTTAEEANASSADAYALSAIVEIHRVMSDPKNYRMRRALHEKFDKHLKKAAMEACKRLIPENESADICDILNRLKQSSEMLHRFNRHLQSRTLELAPGEKSNAREVVERTLMAFDFVALPVSEGIASALRVSRAYRLVFESTAPHILPFVAIQQRLRGDNDYKIHYLQLLEHLDISTFPAALFPR